MSVSKSNDIILNRRSKKEGASRLINIKHDKVVDIYNPYYNYFNERYKIHTRRWIEKGKRTKKNSQTSETKPLPVLQSMQASSESTTGSGSAEKVLAKKKSFEKKTLNAKEEKKKEIEKKLDEKSKQKEKSDKQAITTIQLSPMMKEKERNMEEYGEPDEAAVTAIEILPMIQKTKEREMEEYDKDYEKKRDEETATAIEIFPKIEEKERKTEEYEKFDEETITAIEMIPSIEGKEETKKKRKMKKDKNYKKRMPASEIAVASTSMSASADNARIVQSLSVPSSSPSKSLMETIWRSNDTAERITFLTIYENENRSDDDDKNEDDQKFKTIEKKSKQKDSDDDETIYFSIRSAKEIHIT
ncbi:Cortactin-binding protein [Dirofilaria immitis]